LTETVMTAWGTASQVQGPISWIPN